MAKPSKRKMKAAVRAIVDWAATHGWILQGEKDGSGHWILIHPEHGQVRLPDTPSDNDRGLANAKAKIRRMSGLSSDSGPAARYRHESRRRPRFDMEAAAREARLRRAREEAEALRRARLQIQLDEARHALRKVNPRRDPEVARELAARCVDLEQQLNSP
jgi:hypothetical protein